MGHPKIAQMLQAGEIGTAAGDKVGGKQYLDDAISAMGMQECDYYSAYYLLQKTAGGQGAEKVLEKFHLFWQEMYKQYGQ